MTREMKDSCPVSVLCRTACAAFLQEADGVDPHAGHVDARSDENVFGCRLFEFGDGEAEGVAHVDDALTDVVRVGVVGAAARGA